MGGLPPKIQKYLNNITSKVLFKTFFVILFLLFYVQVSIFFSTNETPMAVASDNQNQSNFAPQILVNAGKLNINYFISSHTFGMTYFFT